MTDKDKKLIYGFFGLKEGTCGWWYHPDKPAMPIHPNLSDISTYFKDAVPKLWVCEMVMHEGTFFSWRVGAPKYGEPINGGAFEDPAEAFGQALLKLIKKTK